MGDRFWGRASFYEHHGQDVLGDYLLCEERNRII
jgi:hypothetical protein